MTPSAAPESAPVTLLGLELTSDCQPPCRRSRSYNGAMRSTGTMTIGQWQQVIASAAGAGVEVVQFTGGKSALFPDLVEYALSAGVKVDVHSPLVHVAEGMWELFARPEVSLGICWYAADPFQHAEITGIEGSWHTARENTVQAVEAGLAPRAEIVTAIDGPSLTEVRAELDKFGIGTITIDRARSAFLTAHDRPTMPEHLCSRCGDGRAGVTWYGAVVPCLVLGRGMIAGTVIDAPLADILTSGLWADILATIPRDSACDAHRHAGSVACPRVGTP